MITYPHGCKDSLFTSVNMNCCNVLYPVANFEIIDCNPVRFKNISTFNGQPALQGDWHWDFGDGGTSTIRNPSHLYTQLGQHTVCMTAVLTDGFSTCCDKVCMDVVACDFGCEAKAAFDYKIMSTPSNTIQLLDKSVGIGIPQTSLFSYTVTEVGQGTQGPFNGPNPIINLAPPVGPSPHIYIVCMDVVYKIQGTGQQCTNHWCEEIVIP